ncbi:MAG: PHP domain-containing protein [Chloroflexota bacterium]|nr:PHP domain-containing protein [Chloroflexota bacterium]
MGPGLQFRNVDLHVHTPASRCFIEPDVSPQDIVTQALAVGMDAIAITDHNSAEWVDRVKEAAQDTDLTVFPGVEITVQPGVHVIALFPTERTGAHIIDLLAKLGIGVDDRGSPEAMVTHGIQEVIAIIRNCDALPVLAHIDDVKGAWRELRGQARIQLWQKAPFAAVEIVGNSLPNAVGRPPYTREPAYYWASDNPHPEQPTKHSHKGIGARYSCFKLDDPITWEGLRQCFDDPDVRIHRGEPIQVTHPLLEQVQIEGGFWDGLDVRLNPDLNCVIGGRGTGKSAFLEIIRYTFDTPAKAGENRQQAQSLLKSVFPSGARATVHFKVGGVRYRVKRISGRVPQVFRLDEDEPLPIAPADLLPVQVYGQKEIYQISLDPEFQLRLLDNYVAEALEPLKKEETRLLRDLRTNADEILRLEEVIDASQEWLVRLGAIREEIRRMEEADFVARVEKMEQYDREKRLLDGAQAQVNKLLRAVQDFVSQHRLDDAVLGDAELAELPNREMLQAQRQILKAINEYLEQQFISLREDIAQKWDLEKVQRDAWQRAYAGQEKAYQKVLDEFARAGEIGPDRYMQLQQRKVELETRAREVKEYKARIVALMTGREQLLKGLRDARKRQYQARCEKAKKLTEALNGSVRVTLWPEGHRQAYKDYLRELFRGLNVRDPRRSELAQVKAAEPEREAQGPVEINGQTRYLVPEIPRYLDPIDLAAAIRIEQQRADEDTSQLETRFNVESDAMRRNMAGLSRRQLFELELFTVPDLPIIELQVAQGLLGYRQLDKLSVGQKCTALLSIVLLESSAPLLIDQPEDDLDNQFIFDQIVTTLRRKKEQRQFLIATHNANIPVSGDAELILVFEAGVNKDDQKQHGWIAEGGIGSIDVKSVKKFVTDILEGGSEAFRIRKKKYGKMIKE